MKTAILLVILLAASVSFGADLDTVKFYNHDVTEQKAFFCNGERLNTVTLNVDMFYIGEINPTLSVIIDSVVFFGDPVVFSFPHEWRHLEGFFDFPLSEAVIYHPIGIGDDTVHIKAYYNGKICPGYLICHAVGSPSVSLGGVVFDTIYSTSGYGYIISNHQERTSILNDVFIGDIYNATYYQSDTPKPTGPNKNIVVRSCAGAIIDSIIPVGDFSSFHFTGGLPSVPLTIAAGDSLVIPYTFIPKVNANKTHYLKFVTHDGKTLNWNFVFDVIPALGVSTKEVRSDQYRVVPNPASSFVTITSDVSSQKEVVVTVFDALGRIVLHPEATTGQSINSVDVSSLPNGSYTLSICTKSHSEMHRFVISK